jgi:ABC-type bacteriocin/lantibiotic exporter with double-glycine peptidase domain|tara:strand:+ start:790 stop:954 length:165 start_codon:yes stop_codon:yes gene_type:complete
MREFLSSRHVSLGCSIVNGVIAVTLLIDQSWILAGICVLASGYCFGNYVKAKDE